MNSLTNPLLTQQEVTALQHQFPPFITDRERSLIGDRLPELLACRRPNEFHETPANTGVDCTVYSGGGCMSFGHLVHDGPFEDR